MLQESKSRIAVLRGISLRSSVENTTTELISAIDLDIKYPETLGLVDFINNGHVLLLRMIAGMILPTNGSCSVNGFPVGHEVSRLVTFYLNCKKSIYFHDGQPLRLQIAFVASHFGITAVSLQEFLSIAQKALSIEDKLLVASNYSEFAIKEQFRIHILLALILRLPLLCIESTSLPIDGDPNFINNILKVVKSIYTPAIVIASSSYLRIEAICDRLTILKNGRIFGTGTPLFWHQKIEQHPMLVFKSTDIKKLRQIAEQTLTPMRVDMDYDIQQMTIILERDEDIKTLITAFKDYHCTIQEFINLNLPIEDMIKTYISKRDSII